MRLINTDSLMLQEFIDADSAPKYAILSHRWGDEGVTHKAWRKGRCTEGAKGYVKIVDACAFARARGQAWLWVDTVCINKDSSQDLSEAINSMWYYYQSATECYAYLGDVIATDPTVRIEQVIASDWFLRGFTLQELIAPERVIFTSSSWDIIGFKYPPNHDPSEVRRLEASMGPDVGLAEEIESVTGIPIDVLAYAESRFVFSVAQRMSWMARRTTTRIEDMAYCLLGLFNINMPLLYGEREEAFSRFQREIFGRTEDETLLAWPFTQPLVTAVPTEVLQARTMAYDEVLGIFASGPHCFKYALDTTGTRADVSPLVLTGRGIQMTATLETSPRAYQTTNNPGLACLVLLAVDQSMWLPHSNPRVAPVETSRFCVFLSKLPCGHYGRIATQSISQTVHTWWPLASGDTMVIHYSTRHQCSHDLARAQEAKHYGGRAMLF
ncbi:hypothetical protein LTR27_009238 [Elasticomyces elasticus]|nr:hypothetical protein LTR27_009238 [Elasticomyces elasticus]